MLFTADVDIDVPPSFQPTDFFTWTKASLVRDGELSQHPCGVYPQQIPIDPLTGLAAIPYDAAEDLGYFKIDFLHLNVYRFFSSRNEIIDLLKKEPDWLLLLVPSNHKKLFQLANHGDLLLKLQPENTEDLADVLALIRPGKRQLLALYQKDKKLARTLLWAKDNDAYSFKKSHALSYALVIQLQLHLIEQGRL